MKKFNYTSYNSELSLHKYLTGYEVRFPVERMKCGGPVALALVCVL